MKPTWLCVFLTILTASMPSLRRVSGAKLCDSTIFKCPYGQVCFEYYKKEFYQWVTNNQLLSRNAPTGRICLDVNKICGSAAAHRKHLMKESIGDHAGRVRRQAPSPITDDYFEQGPAETAFQRVDNENSATSDTTEESVEESSNPTETPILGTVTDANEQPTVSELSAQQASTTDQSSPGFFTSQSSVPVTKKKESYTKRQPLHQLSVTSSHVRASDEDSCRSHDHCWSADGGIALCCNYRCVHVHKHACVREFLDKDNPRPNA